MKSLVDLFPIVLFFVAFKLAGIYVATGVAILATLVQIGWLHVRHGKVEPMQWISLVVIVFFGGATLVFHDETFIKWKPSILYWLMGAVLAGGMWVLKKNFIQSLMGAQLSLPDHVWRQLVWAWALFFAAMGVINWWVAFHFDTDTWVNYKLFGSMGLMLVFVLAQGLYLSRHMQTPEDPTPQDET